MRKAIVGTWRRLLSEAEANEKVRCIIVTGNEKAFAAGADIKEMQERTFVDVAINDVFGDDPIALSKVRKPVIAAVAGYALGGGCELGDDV